MDSDVYNLATDKQLLEKFNDLQRELRCYVKFVRRSRALTLNDVENARVESWEAGFDSGMACAERELQETFNPRLPRNYVPRYWGA